jgi:hypothetical protein
VADGLVDAEATGWRGRSTLLEAMRTRADGAPASGATVNTHVAAVKALLNCWCQ